MATLAPHLSRHPKGIREEERFWLEKRRKRVRGNDRVHGREVEIGFRQRQGDGSCVAGEIDIQIGNFNDVSGVKAICTLILLFVSIFYVSLTKL
jgi:hypothetical protein